MDGESLWNCKKKYSFLSLPQKQKELVSGLVCAGQIIKRHGGNFYLQESRQGKTIFVIEWPVASFILK